MNLAESGASSARAAVESSGSEVEECSTILVVGNVTLAPRTVQGLLAAGFSLALARTAGEAQRFVGDQVPAAIALGPCQGPGPYGVVRWFRSKDRLAFVPVFFFSPLVDRGEVAAGIAAGADDVFAEVQAPGSTDDVAERIAARIARARSLSRLALFDPLTELQNRRSMTDRLSAEMARARRTNTPLSMALLDLDDFKAINDTLGHVAGDRALVAFARALRAGGRRSDVVFRFGGDEFILLLPGCDAPGARAACAQLRARHAWALPDLPAITFSSGIAQFPENGTSWADLFGVADENLRRAKRGGRDRTVGPDEATDP